jgi:hypothetical protein
MPRRAARRIDALLELDALFDRLTHLSQQLHQQVRKEKREKRELKKQLECLRSVARANGFNVEG